MNLEGLSIAAVIGGAFVGMIFLLERWMIHRAARRMVARVIDDLERKAQGQQLSGRAHRSYFCFIISLVLMGAGILSSSWFGTVFFSLCALVIWLEPYFPNPNESCGYHLLLSNDEIACEHPKRKRESIRWEEVRRIWFVTTSDGPWIPDKWLLFEGEAGGCSVPEEAEGFSALWDELKTRCPGFAYLPIALGGTHDARHLCWQKPGAIFRDNES